MVLSNTRTSPAPATYCLVRNVAALVKMSLPLATSQRCRCHTSPSRLTQGFSLHLCCHLSRQKPKSTKFGWPTTSVFPASGLHGKVHDSPQKLIITPRNVTSGEFLAAWQRHIAYLGACVCSPVQPDAERAHGSWACNLHSVMFKTSR